jgi:RNA-directed DNA polymerase
VNVNSNKLLDLKGNPWMENGHIFAAWTAESQTLLRKTMQQLQSALSPYLKASCTHIKGKGNGSVKGTTRWLVRQLQHFQFVARFDVDSYYQSMRHDVLLRQLDELRVSQNIRGIVKDYLAVPDIKGIGIGMVAGGSLSPLLGALYLLPLDYAMQEHMAKQGIFYVRYMDDILIFAKTRWHLRDAIRTMYSVIQSLGLTLHQQEKRFIGRAKKGFDFLGYHFHPSRKLRPSAESLRRLVKRARRLYEQKGDFNRVWQYVTRWVSYIRGGLDGLVSLAGGIRRYWVYILMSLNIRKSIEYVKEQIVR